MKRLKFAKLMIELVEKGKRIINYDESTVDQEHYIRKSWCKKRDSNRQFVERITPKLGLVACVDSEGNKFIGFSDGTTNSKTTKVMLSFLI